MLALQPYQNVPTSGAITALSCTEQGCISLEGFPCHQKSILPALPTCSACSRAGMALPTSEHLIWRGSLVLATPHPVKVQLIVKCISKKPLTAKAVPPAGDLQGGLQQCKEL